MSLYSENTTEIAIKILQGSTVTQSALGGLVIHILLQISYSVRLAKLGKSVDTDAKAKTK